MAELWDIGDGFGLGSHCMTSEVEKTDTMSNGSGLVLRRSLLTLARMLFLQQLAGRKCPSCRKINSEEILMITIVVCQVAEGLQYDQWFWCIVLDNGLPRSRDRVWTI
jgi:hypothetical protein